MHPVQRDPFVHELGPRFIASVPFPNFLVAIGPAMDQRESVVSRVVEQRFPFIHVSIDRVDDFHTSGLPMVRADTN